LPVYSDGNASIWRSTWKVNARPEWQLSRRGDTLRRKMDHPAGIDRMAERFSTITVEKIGPVARLTLNRAERANALNATMLGEIGSALDEIERDAGLRALIVRGAGAAFSSGFDLKEQMERRPKGVEAWRPILRHDFDTIMRFWHFPLPTIATVRGPCLAGACELALACDITIASDDAFFGEPELKFGAGIVAMLLPWIAGPKIAKEIILLGEDRIPAARAREIGMVNRVVRPDELEQTGLAIADHIAAIDPDLVKATKRAINRAFEARNMLDALEEALAIDLAIEGAGSPDKIQFMEIARRDGLKAALAWRDARFPGRPA
jgi:enoyl-CoA hydratase